MVWRLALTVACLIGASWSGFVKREIRKQKLELANEREGELWVVYDPSLDREL